MADLLIVGTGAMALLFASRLAEAGFGVTLLGTWEEGITAINQSGVRVLHRTGAVNYPVKAEDRPERIQGARLALVLVKSWQTERAASQLSQVLHPQGVALTLQNGLGNREILASHLGEERVAQGVTTYGATLVAPGQVRPGGEGLVSVQDHPRILPLLDALRNAGIAVQQVQELSGLIWGKLVINVAINPLTALLGVRNGALLQSDSARRVMGMAAEEAAAVAGSEGIQLPFQSPAAAAEAVAESTASNISSMLQDLKRGAPTEIDVLCGAVAKTAEAHHLAVPVNELLWRLIRTRVDLGGVTINDNG
jgi:2-dehydropantoate 2-reductase